MIDKDKMDALVKRLSDSFNAAAASELKALEAEGIKSHAYRMGIVMAHCAALGSIVAWNTPAGREEMLSWLVNDGMGVVERFATIRGDRVDEMLAEYEATGSIN